MKKKILLVDDDPGVRRMLLRVLEEEDYVVLPAANGVEALEVARATAPDLVLLDLNLPMQNGWDTFRAARCRAPAPPGGHHHRAAEPALSRAWRRASGRSWRNRWICRSCCARFVICWRNRLKLGWPE